MEPVAEASFEVPMPMMPGVMASAAVPAMLGKGAVVRGGKDVDFLDADHVAQLDGRHFAGGDFQIAFLGAGEKDRENKKSGNEWKRIHDERS